MESFINKHQDRIGNGNIGAKTNGPGFNKRQQSHHKKDDNNKNPFAPSTSAVGVLNRAFFPFEDSADHHICGEIVALFLVDEIYAIPVGFNVPQRDEKQNIVQIKRKGLLAHLGLGPKLILLSLFQLTQRYDL